MVIKVGHTVPAIGRGDEKAGEPVPIPVARYAIEENPETGETSIYDSQGNLVDPKDIPDNWNDLIVKDELSNKRKSLKDKIQEMEDEVLDYDRVMESFDKVVEYLAGMYTDTMNTIHYMHDKYAYEAGLMALHDGEVHRFMAFGAAGLSIIADSFSAMKYAKVKPVRNEEGITVDFEIEGEYFAQEDSVKMIIGDGLGYNFFDYPLSQSLRVEELGLGHMFHISGVVLDSFYSGFAGYVDLEVMQEDLNFSEQDINLLLLKIRPGEYDSVIDNIELIISGNLGDNFTYINLNQTFDDNLQYLNNLTLYPAFLIIVMAVISILSLYNYQKGSIIDKAKDFLIMKAVGSKYKNIKKILFLEALYVIIPSLFLSLGIGMILNSLVLFQRVSLPHILTPFIIIGILFLAFLTFNYLSLFPILRKIKKFTIKDFDIY